jgi:type I restriction enzyme S subunit
VEKNDINAPVWSITNDRGFVLSEDNFSERVASQDTSNYKLVPPNHFAYSTARVNVGSINYNRGQKTGCVSPAIGIVFKVKEEAKIIPQFLFCLFQSEQFKEQVNNYAFGTVRQTLS